MNEFFQQGDREKAAGLPTSALMDRVTTKIPQAQLGFINVLVRPLLSAWTEANQKGLWDTASASPVTNTVVHTPFHAWPSPVTAGASSGSGNVTLAGSVRNMGECWEEMSCGTVFPVMVMAASCCVFVWVL